MGSPPARRLPRSGRMLVAVVLVLVGAGAVLAAVLVGDPVLLSVAGGAAAVLGVAATRTTYLDLAECRHEAAADRAELAQAYRDLTVARVADQAAYLRCTEARLEAHRQTITGLVDELVAVRREAAQTRRATDREQERAAQVRVRCGELEHERDLLHTQLEAEQAARQQARYRYGYQERPPVRRRA